MKYPTFTVPNSSRKMVDVFKGYNHNLRIGNGEFFDMKNMTSDYYPILAPRGKRGVYAAPDAPSGLIAKDNLCYVDGTDFVINGYPVAMGLSTAEEDCPKQLISMGAYVIILPDKKYINTADITEFGNIEARFTSSEDVSFTLCKIDGSNYTAEFIQDDEPSDPQNMALWIDTSSTPHTLKQWSATSGMWVSIATTYIKISSPGIGAAFEQYDGVTISGVIAEELQDLNATMVVWDRADDYIVVIGVIDNVMGQTVEEGKITVTRQMPNMDFVVESENRLWGCRYGVATNGEVVNEVYASKLGDFKNWNCFMGISTDSYAASVGTDGQFTGAITMPGYVLFFKEGCIHKVYGNYPANFQIQTTICRGVQRGCERSLAVVNEIIYYKARHAICAYDGSLPTEISAPLGEMRYNNAVAGAHGNKYYISMEDTDGNYHLFVYDTAIVAIHHLDAPWRPGDVEQRNGRAYRQGNINDEVENFTYVTEGSFDARLWDILERKQNFINQVMNGENVGRETEDTGEVTLSAAEVKALASGSPLIMEQVQLDTDIKKLESLYRAHRSAVANARSRMETDKGNIATFENFAANGKKDLAARVDTYSEGKFSITIGKKNITDKKDAGMLLMAEATAKATEEGYTTIGKFAGFDLRVIKTHEGIKGQISGNQAYSFNTYPGNTTYMISHLIGKVEGIDEAVKLWEHKIIEAKQDMAEQEKLINQPFAKQAELEQKRARYNEVMEILNPKEEQALDSMDEDAVQYQRRKNPEVDKPKKNKRSKYSETETLFMIWANGSDRVGERKRFFRFGKIHYYEKTENGCIELSRAQYNERRGYNAQDIDRRAGREISQVVNRDGNFEGRSSGGINGDRHSGGASAVSGQVIGEELRNDVRGSVPGAGRDNRGTAINSEEPQYQQRTNTLTNREVLAMAASELQTEDLSTAERDALGIFQKRLSNLETLQEERAELGRLYKDQQFGAKVDRAAAEQTRNRMKVMDGQIEKAKAEVLSIEDKQVLKQILQKARKVVEKQQWTKDEEKLKRYRDRRNNADAIKKYRGRLQKDVNDLTNWVLHPNNKDVVKHIPDVLKNSVIPFLSSIDFTSTRSLRGGNATKADQEFMKRLNGLKAALKPNQSVEGLYGDYSDLPPNFMERLQLLIDSAQAIVDSKTGEFVVNQMTSQELRELSQVVRNLKTYIQQFNRFHANAMFQHVSEAGDNTIGDLGEMGNASDKTGNVSNFVFWQQIRPAYAFERFGNGGKAIYDGLRRGQATLAFNTKKIQEFAEKAYTEKEVKAWEKEIKSIRLGNDIVKMPVSTIMSFYELSKRPQALGHILVGGVRVATFTAKGKKISDVGHTITMSDVQAIIGTLTERQKEVADTLQRFMQEQGGKWGNYVSVKRFGEELFGEEHYFPINSDGRHLAANADEHPSAASLYALLNMGFTKATQEGANNRVVLYSIFDVFANHMASMAQYNAFALPVVDAIKWFN